MRQQRVSSEQQSIVLHTRPCGKHVAKMSEVGWLSVEVLYWCVASLCVNSTLHHAVPLQVL